MNTNKQPQKKYRFEGAIITSVEEYRAVPCLPVRLNPWRWRARRRAVERVEPALHSDGEAYTDDRWEITFRLTDIELDDMVNRFNIGWKFALRLQATDRVEARERAEDFLGKFRYAADHTISNPREVQKA